LDLEPFGYQ